MIWNFHERSANWEIPANFKKREETRSKRQIRTETSIVEASHPVLVHHYTQRFFLIPLQTGMGYKIDVRFLFKFFYSTQKTHKKRANQMSYSKYKNSNVPFKQVLTSDKIEVNFHTRHEISADKTTSRPSLHQIQYLASKYSS